MASSVSGRRLGDISAITLLTLFCTIPLTALAFSSASLFSATRWARIAFLIPSLLGSILLLAGSISGLYLIWRSERSGGPLGVPDWFELSAASCAISMVGFILQSSAYIVLIPAAIQSHLNPGFLWLISVAAAFLSLATLYAGYHALRAYREDYGDDVIEFENTEIPSPHDKVDTKYWSTEDDDEVVDGGKGLQY